MCGGVSHWINPMSARQNSHMGGFLLESIRGVQKMHPKRPSWWWWGLCLNNERVNSRISSPTPPIPCPTDTVTGCQGAAGVTPASASPDDTCSPFTSSIRSQLPVLGQPDGEGQWGGGGRKRGRIPFPAPSCSQPVPADQSQCPFPPFGPQQTEPSCRDGAQGGARGASSHRAVSMDPPFPTSGGWGCPPS